MFIIAALALAATHDLASNSAAPYVDEMPALAAQLRRGVLHNVDGARILRTLRQRGVRVVDFDAVDPHSIDSGYAWHVDGGYLYLFPYRTVQAARAAQRRFRRQSVYGYETGNKLYRCHTTVAVLTGLARDAAATMKRLCGQPEPPGPIGPER